jgi:hypothetical protein
MLGGNAEKVFMTGKKWPSEVEGFKRDSYGMKDFNSSDIILKRGKTYFGVSLKKKQSKTAEDPTVLNKAFDSLLNGDKFTPVKEQLERKKEQFYVTVIQNAMKEGKLNKRPVSAKNWKTFLGGGKEGTKSKLGNDYVNKSLKSTGNGRYTPTKGAIIEDADTYDIDTIVEKMDSLGWSDRNITIEFNKRKLQAFDVGAGAAKLQYVLKVSNMDIIKFEIRYKGVGFGLGFGVNIDLADTQNSGSVGSFNWGGAASTFFWVDPQEELICILMTQLMPSGYYPIRVQMQSMVYSAFID